VLFPDDFYAMPDTKSLSRAAPSLSPGPSRPLRRSMRLRVAFLGLLIANWLTAQNLSGTIEGKVSGPDGEIISGALVTATHAGTNTSYTAETTGVGRFAIPGVRLGGYVVSAEAQGFQRAAAEDVLVQVGGAATVLITLSAGEATFAATTSAGSAQPDLNLVNAELGGVADQRRVLALPLNGRNAVELALLQAGVDFERDNLGQGDKLFIHGQRHRAIQFTLDGIDTQDNLNRASTTMIDQPLLPMAAENVQEFRVITGLAPAEFGRGGAQITAVTRAGGNDLHGSLFEFHRNTVWNANDFFNNSAGVSRPPLVRNQFGGRLGGPLIQNKTFFYLGYQQTREARAIAVNRTVYTAQARQGTFRFLDGLRTTPQNAAANPGRVRSLNLLECSPAVEASLGRGCFDGRFTTANPSTPDPFVSGEVFGLTPTPNNFDLGDGLNTGGFRFNTPSKTAEHLPAARLDHRFNDVHAFYATLNYVDRDIQGDFINNREPKYPGQPPLGRRATHAKGSSAGLTSTFSPALINEFRFGFLGGENAFLITQPFPTGFTLNLNTITNPYDPASGDEVRDNEVFHLRDTVSWVRGKHQLKFGGEWRQRTIDTYNFDLGSPFGEISLDDNDNPPGFSNGEIGARGGGAVDTNDAETARDLMNNLTGALGQIRQRFNVSSLDSGFVPNQPQRRIYRNRELDLFAQDAWFLTPNLTLNWGLRWEYASVPVETKGLLLAPEGGLDAVFGATGRGGFFRPGVFDGPPCASLGNLPRPQTTANAVAFIEDCATKYFPAGAVNGRPLWNDDYNNFAPVVGLAWDPFGDGRTSIRAGFRISYMQDAFSIIDGNLDDNEGLLVDQICTPTAGDCRNNPAGPHLLRDLGQTPAVPRTPEFALPSFRSILDSNSADFRVFDPNLATPYYSEWTLSLAREIRHNLALEVRYVGNRGTKLRRLADFNEINIHAVDPVTATSFLDSFLTARSNLNCNRSTGNASFGFDDASGAPCIQANPLMGALIAGEPDRLRTNAVLQEALDFGEAGHFANQYMQAQTARPGPGQARIRGGSFWGQVLAGRFPANFFMANPFVASARGMVNDSFSTYHAIEIELRRRLAAGFTLQANYTYGKALSDYDGDDNTLFNATRPSAVRNPRYTLQQFMPRQQFNANWLYELPFGPGKPVPLNNGLTRALLGGWQTGGLLSWRGGRPFSILSGLGAFHTRFVSQENTVDLAQPLSNTELASQTGRRDIGGGVYWIDPCTSAVLGGDCNSSAVQGLFQLPAAGRLGELPQTPFTGPGRFLFDFNLVKRHRLRERTDIEFRWEVFNFFNNANLGLPDNNILSSNFGQIAQTISAPRLMQFALKLNF
jgi:hypothetical protein